MNGIPPRQLIQSLHRHTHTMPSGSHPLGFGAVQSSSTRVSSPLATSFGFGSTAAGPSTPTTTSPYPYTSWASPHNSQTVASPHHVVNPNPFAHAFARTEPSSSSAINRPSATPQAYEGSGHHAKRRRSGSEDEGMERRSVSPGAGARTMKRLRQGRDHAQAETREETGEGEPEADLGVLLGTSAPLHHCLNC